MIAARLSIAIAIGTAILFGLGFFVGMVAGVAYSSRDKVCADFGRGVPVCDYAYRPDPESFVR